LKTYALNEMQLRPNKYCDVCSSQNNVVIKPRKNISRLLDLFQREYMYVTRRNPFSPSVFMAHNLDINSLSQSEMIHDAWSQYWMSKVEFSCLCEVCQTKPEMSEADKKWLQVPVGTIKLGSQLVMESILKNVRKRIKARRPKIIEPTPIVEDEGLIVPQVEEDLSSPSMEGVPKPSRKPVGIPIVTAAEIDTNMTLPSFDVKQNSHLLIPQQEALIAEESSELGSEQEDLVSSDSDSETSSEVEEENFPDHVIEALQAWFELALEQYHFGVPEDGQNN